MAAEPDYPAQPGVASFARQGAAASSNAGVGKSHGIAHGPFPGTGFLLPSDEWPEWLMRREKRVIVRQWRRRCLAGFVLTLLVGMLILPGLSAAQAPSPVATPTAPSPGVALAHAVTWIASQQNADGGFGKPGKSDPSTTSDVVVALGAAQRAALDVDLTKAVQYLGKQALVFTQTGPGQAAKLVLAMKAANQDPTDVNGVNPLAIVEKAASTGSGQIGTGLYDHALGILALAATSQTVPDKAIALVKEKQIADGSWAFDGSTEQGKGDSNTTALMVQALVAAAHGSDPMVTKAMAYLKSVQAENGAFAYQPANPLVPDANSTALAVQAILATGGDPAGPGWNNASGALAGFANPSGALRYNDQQRDDNLYATAQAIPALASQILPIATISTGTVCNCDTPTPPPPTLAADLPTGRYSVAA